MTEKTPTTTQPEATGTQLSILGARTLQLLSATLAVVGFIWATGDILTAMFPADSVVTPVSVLLMLYGSVGTVAFEGLVRFLTRKKSQENKKVG